MTTINPRLTYAIGLQSYFVDKDTGLPLINGVVTFYKDSARTILKNVFELTGAPGAPVYTALPNPMTLSGVGTPQDAMGNDILILYYPYEGTPDDGNENPAVELYYITVDAAPIPPALTGVRQFTRELFPNLASGEVTTANDQFNYIPNGQFLIHNNLPADPLHSPAYIDGEIREATTDIAQGGWTFERSAGATTKDIVTFPEFDGYTGNPTASPRFACNIACTNSGTNAFKYLGIKWRGVNTFSSASQSYNFYIEAKTQSGNANVQLYLIKYFGATGTAFTPVLIGTLALTNTYQKFNTSFIFGSNGAYEIGEGEEDTTYVQIVAQLPATSTFNYSFDNAALISGSNQLAEFPVQTEADCLTRSVPGWLPIMNPDGSDLFLIPRSNKTGMTWDYSEIGTSVTEFNNAYLYEYDLETGLHNTTNLMLVGEYTFKTSGYSHLGIPFSRLQAKLFNTDFNCPIWGTGKDFATQYVIDTAIGVISTNGVGAATPAADSSPAVGFTFNHICSGADYKLSVFNGLNQEDGNFITIKGQFVIDSSIAAPTAGDSGFTVEQGLEIYSGQFHTWYISNTSLPTAGHYFTFTSQTAPSTQTNYYVWFRINGSGSDPTPGGTGIRVDLLSTYNSDDVALAVAMALGGSEATQITFTAASAITSGRYWTFGTPNLNEYYVWYKKGGSGTDPAIAGKIGIEVDIGSSDTAAQVTTKTQTAINSAYFSSPPVRGMFLRCYDPNSTWDPQPEERLSFNQQGYGNHLGTIELMSIQEHIHPITPATSATGDTNNEYQAGTTARLLSSPVVDDQHVLPEGYPETKPVNAYVNMAIRY